MKKLIGGALAAAAFLGLSAFVTPMNAPLYVPNNAALQGLSTAASHTVFRYGYTTAGDTAVLTYVASGAVCSLNSGNGDNGSQVKSQDGKCWLAVMPAGVFDVTEFGADPTNTTSSTTAFNNALAAAIAQSGTVRIPPGDYQLGAVAGAFTAQPQSVKIQGAGQGQSRLHCSTSPCLTMSYAGMQNATHIDGLGLCATTTNINGIVLQNLNAVPNSFYDQEVNTLTNVTWQGCDGPQHTDYFANALMTIGVDAVNLSYAQVYASSTDQGNGWTIQGYQVTGPTNAGTPTSSPTLSFAATPTGVYAGMQVYDQNSGSFVGTVLSTSATTVTLVANSASTVTSGDTVQFFNQAFIFTASNVNFNGTAAGIIYTGGAQGLFVTQSNFAGTQGIIAPGNAFGLTQLTVTNSQFNTVQEDIDTGSLVTDTVISGNVFYVTDNTGSHPALLLNKVARLSFTGNVLTDNHSGGTAPSAVSIVNDSAEGGSLIGNQLYGFSTGFSLGASTSFLTAGPNSFSGTTTRYIDNGTSNLLYDSGTWTPGLTTSGTVGTPTYAAARVGSYEINGRLVTARFNFGTTAWTGSPTGNLSMTGLPFTSTSTANDIGNCYFEQWGGVILASGYTFLGAQVPTGGTSPLLVQSGSGIASNAVAIGIATQFTLIGQCSYHR